MEEPAAIIQEEHHAAGARRGAAIVKPFTCEDPFTQPAIPRLHLGPSLLKKTHKVELQIASVRTLEISEIVFNATVQFCSESVGEFVLGWFLGSIGKQAFEYGLV